MMRFFIDFNACLIAMVAMPYYGRDRASLVRFTGRHSQSGENELGSF